MAETTTSDTYTSTNHHKYTVDNWFYQKHLNAFLERLDAMVMETEPTTLLDAGCGEGFVVNYLAQRHPEVRMTGVDLSEGAVKYAQEHFGEHATYRTGSLYKLPFSDNSFDTVLCSEVLEHLDEPNKAVAELKRVARNYVVITVPREPYFQWLNNVGQWLGLSPDPEHVNFWTPKTFQQFIRGHFAEATFDWKQLYQLAAARV